MQGGGAEKGLGRLNDHPSSAELAWLQAHRLHPPYVGDYAKNRPHEPGSEGLIVCPLLAWTQRTWNIEDGGAECPYEDSNYAEQNPDDGTRRCGTPTARSGILLYYLARHIDEGIPDFAGQGSSRL